MHIESREMSRSEARSIRSVVYNIYYVTDSAAAVGPPVGLAQALPNYSQYS